MGKHLNRYDKLASSNGYPDPLKYLFGRLKANVQAGNHRAAEALAKELIPYGHGKRAPVLLGCMHVVEAGHGLRGLRRRREERRIGLLTSQHRFGLLQADRADIDAGHRERGAGDLTVR